MIIVCASEVSPSFSSTSTSLSLTCAQELVVSLSKKDPRFELIVRTFSAHAIVCECHFCLPDDLSVTAGVRHPRVAEDRHEEPPKVRVDWIL